MKKRENDYQQLYYDLLYENHKFIKKIKELEEELEILKRNENNSVKDIIIKEIIMYKKRKNGRRKQCRKGYE